MEQELREFIIRKYVMDSKLTLLDDKKFSKIFIAIKDIIKRKTPGASAELGAYKGGASYYIAKLLDRKHYVFDTFEGIPNSGKYDSILNGAFANVKEIEVKQLLKGTKSVVVKGYFTGDMPDEPFCLSHFDGDTYQSCKDHLKYFYKNTVKGGFLFFDDYNFSKAKGVKVAIEEFLAKNTNHEIAFTSANHQFCIKK